MKKLLAAIMSMAIPMVVNMLKEREAELAKKFADSQDIPFIGEKGEEKLAAGIISAVCELLEDIKK